MVKLNILIANTNYLISKGLESLIIDNSDFGGSLVVRNKAELFENIDAGRPHVLIIDFSAEEFNTDTLQMLNQRFSGLNILAITPDISARLMAKAMKSGLTSYVLNHCEKDEILEAIYKTASGERFVCGKILDQLMRTQSGKVANGINSPTSCEGLNITEREMEIVGLIAAGFSNKEIAERLFLSTHTVSTHRKNIMSKLGVNNTAGVVMFAVRENLLSYESRR